MSRRFWALLAVAGLVVASLGSAVAVNGAVPGSLVAKLSAAHEVPSNNSAGTGSAQVIIQGDGASIFYQVFYSDTSGPVVAAHIHLGAIGVNGPIMLPLAVGPSPFSGTLTAANFTGANGLTYAEAIAAIRTGGAYVNLHTALHPGGEIRGQLYDNTNPQSYVISADAPEAVPAGHLWGYNDYFPRTLTVAQGSVVTVVLKGFHTATLLPAGMTAAQDFATGGSVIVNDTDDTVPNTNGTTRTELSLPAISPILPSASCGTPANPCSFDGTKVVSEGVPFDPTTPPTAIRIDAPTGTYVFHCRVHPTMIGWLNVVTPPSGDGDAPDDVTSNAASQLATEAAAAAATEAAASVPTFKWNANGTRTWLLRAGAETPDHRVAILEMLPAKVTIGPNDRVAWRVSGRSEPHTVTFPKDLNADSVPRCEGPGGDDVACQGPPDELENGGGNGVATITSPTTESDSGIVMAAVAVQAYGVPASAVLHKWQVRFNDAEAGTYTYVCQIHDGMAGTIIVK